ncbi:hypothetical protein [Eleftheria terrae]|uniref:hypothetical protein n=1 Tax=Eleftheria terrae TaxID=1597781 RepID=UPI00263B4553|nr:hypothetical protein [Eleftheria terrae]WKB53326.1 hypothetical protein N7L95_02705 [Eleftheria terrae]
MQRVIYLQAAAPAKPAEGQACNGCGVCCADEPCPLGQLLGTHRRGGCRALAWNEAQGRYRCGAITEPATHLPKALRWAAPALSLVARRLVAAGKGCDSSVMAQRPG